MAAVKFKDVESLYEGRLRGNQLMLSGLSIGPEEAQLLWDSPKMQEVTWLDLDDNRLGDEGVKALAQCGFLAEIQYLNLNSNGVGDEGLKALGRSPVLKKLKRLHLKNNPIAGDGVVNPFEQGWAKFNTVQQPRLDPPVKLSGAFRRRICD